MAHEIGEMFYYGDVPWHGLGRNVEQPATVDEALVAGGLDWEVDLVPIATAEAPPSPAPHRVAVVRRDREPGDPDRVLGVVHPEFRPLQNREGAQLFDQLFDAGARKYHTGGYLRNGEVVWLLARMPENIEVDQDDILETYLLYTNSHDGSIGIDIRLTTVRVVCRNTLSFALASGAAERVFSRRHRDDPGVLEQDAKAFFTFLRLQTAATAEKLRMLATRPLEDEGFRRFLWRILPNPEAPATANTNPSVARAHATRLENLEQARAEIFRTRTEGIPARGVPPDLPTWWGAVNAVTAWVDHLRPINGDRYANALLGAGDRLKSTAYQHAVAEASGLVVSIEDRRESHAGPARA